MSCTVSAIQFSPCVDLLGKRANDVIDRRAVSAGDGLREQRHQLLARWHVQARELRLERLQRLGQNRRRDRVDDAHQDRQLVHDRQEQPPASALR
jgi:hypothetical protein